MLGGGQDCYYWEDPITAIDSIDPDTLLVGSLHGSLGLIHLKTGQSSRTKFDQLDHIIGVSVLSTTLFLVQTKLGIIALAHRGEALALVASLTLQVSGFSPFPVRGPSSGKHGQERYVVFTTDHTKNPEDNQPGELLKLEVNTLERSLAVGGIELTDRAGLVVKDDGIAANDWAIVRASTEAKDTTLLFYMNEVYRIALFTQRS